MKDAINTQLLVKQFIEETNYKLQPIKKEIEVNDMFDFKDGKLINYGNINNIIHTKEFEYWYKQK